MSRNPQEEYIELYRQMASVCKEQGWGDPFSYARSKEIYAACKLNHKIADEYSGADAITQSGEEVEYKSTIGSKVKGAYTGISVQPTWEKQVEYLKKDKILKYSEHYFNRFENGALVESWRLTGQQVYDILLPKLKKKFSTALTKKDPRLAANVSYKNILEQGTRVL